MRIDSNGRVVMGGGSLAAPRTADLQIHTDAGGGAVSFGNESSVVISTNATAAGNQGYIGSLWFGSQDIGSTNQYGWKLAGIAGYVAGDTGTSGASADLLFYTASSSQTGTERMRINSSGSLLVGTTDEIIWTDASGEGIVLYRGEAFQVARNSDSCVQLNRQGTDGQIQAFAKSGTQVGNISVTGSATAYNTSSDHRLKENVDYTFDATTRLKQLRPARFNFIADADTTVDGFLAHEVQSVVPEAITGTHNEVDDDGNPVYQGIDQSKLVPLLVKTIQELEARIVALESA
jgi:hypothetical protein